MARVAKSLSEKENELLKTITDAKMKLAKLQQRQKIEIGELACKHGLHQFDMKALGNAFKSLSEKMAHEHKSGN